jgi:phosphomannomutase
MITASHNPPAYNGIKLFDCRGASIQQSDYLSIISGLSNLNYASWGSLGSSKEGEGLHSYVEQISSVSRMRKKWRVGVDPGNGATVVTAPLVLTMAGASVSAINLSPDGCFPGRGAEPDGAALAGLSKLVRENILDVGIALDGDGDRISVVDEKGVQVPQDLALGFVAASSIKDRGKGTVVVNVDTSAVVDMMVESAGGKVIRTKVGDTYILEELVRSGSPFGGESCGAWIHPKHSLCPDGTLSSLILLNLLEEADLKPSEIGRGLPIFHLTRKTRSSTDPWTR